MTHVIDYKATPPITREVCQECGREFKEGDMFEATIIKEVCGIENPNIVRQVLLDMRPPLEGSEYVLASAARVGGRGEVLLFAATSAGEVRHWIELRGSQVGTLDIGAALHDLGYEMKPCRHFFARTERTLGIRRSHCPDCGADMAQWEGEV